MKSTEPATLRSGAAILHSVLYGFISSSSMNSCLKFKNWGDCGKIKITWSTCRKNEKKISMLKKKKWLSFTQRLSILVQLLKQKQPNLLHFFYSRGIPQSIEISFYVIMHPWASIPCLFANLSPFVLDFWCCVRSVVCNREILIYT